MDLRTIVLEVTVEATATDEDAYDRASIFARDLDVRPEVVKVEWRVGEGVTHGA